MEGNSISSESSSLKSLSSISSSEVSSWALALAIASALSLARRRAVFSSALRATGVGGNGGRLEGGGVCGRGSDEKGSSSNEGDREEVLGMRFSIEDDGDSWG